MRFDSAQIIGRLSAVLHQDWSAKVRLSARARAIRSFDCRGPVQLHLASSAVISASTMNYIGDAVLGAATKRHDPTVIVVEDSAHLELCGVSIGRGTTLRVHQGARLRIGHGTFVNNGSNITASESITIGENCAISWGVTILDSDGHQSGKGSRRAPVCLQDHVWVGANATILKGVTVGAGSIVGAGAVVTRSCGPASLIVGSPARVVKSGVEWRV